MIRMSRAFAGVESDAVKAAFTLAVGVGERLRAYRLAVVQAGQEVPEPVELAYREVLTKIVRAIDAAAKSAGGAGEFRVVVPATLYSGYQDFESATSASDALNPLTMFHRLMNTGTITLGTSGTVVDVAASESASRKARSTADGLATWSAAVSMALDCVRAGTCPVTELLDRAKASVGGGGLGMKIALGVGVVLGLWAIVKAVRR